MRSAGLLIAALGALAATTAAQDAAPPPGRTRFPDWDARDAEGRWALIAPALDRGEDKAWWTAFLQSQAAAAELEWLATSGGDAGAPALQALLAVDAVIWLRAAAWRLDCADSHSAEHAAGLLAARPELFLAWADLHEEHLTPAVRAARETVAREHPLAAADGAAAAGFYAAPLADAEVFGALFGAAEAVPFGARLVAEPGVVYDQQVERAVRALEACTRRSPEARAALLGLARHPSERLALAGLLAFTHFESHEVPDEELAALAHDPGLAAARRSAAFLASTYGYAPRAFLWLHDAAGMPSHEHWGAAVDRLGEVGNGYTLRLLEERQRRPEGGVRSDEQRRELEAAITELRARAAVEEREVALKLETMLEVAAYADLVCAPIELGLVSWTLATVRAHAGRADVQAALCRLRDGYEPGPEAGERSLDMRQRVRDYAAGLLR